MANGKPTFYLDEAINQLKKELLEKYEKEAKGKLEKAVCPKCGQKANSKEQVNKLFGFRLQEIQLGFNHGVEYVEGFRKIFFDLIGFA